MGELLHESAESDPLFRRVEDEDDELVEEDVAEASSERQLSPELEQAVERVHRAAELLAAGMLEEQSLQHYQNEPAIEAGEASLRRLEVIREAARRGAFGTTGGYEADMLYHEISGEVGRDVMGENRRLNAYRRIVDEVTREARDVARIMQEHGAMYDVPPSETIGWLALPSLERSVGFARADLAAAPLVEARQATVSVAGCDQQIFEIRQGQDEHSWGRPDADLTDEERAAIAALEEQKTALRAELYRRWHEVLNQADTVDEETLAHSRELTADRTVERHRPADRIGFQAKQAGRPSQRKYRNYLKRTYAQVHLGLREWLEAEGARLRRGGNHPQPSRYSGPENLGRAYLYAQSWLGVIHNRSLGIADDDGVTPASISPAPEEQSEQ